MRAAWVCQNSNSAASIAQISDGGKWKVAATSPITSSQFRGIPPKNR